MGVVAIFLMWTGLFEQALVSLSKEVSIWNLSSIGPVVLEEKIFENVDWQRTNGGVIGILLTQPMSKKGNP